MRMPFALIVSTLLASCAVGPDFQTPEAPKTQHYTKGPIKKEIVSANVKGGQSQQFIQGQDIPYLWWQVFRASELDNLIKEALQASPTLAMAKAKLLQAQEDFNAQFGTTQFPNVDASASAIRQQVNLQSFGINNLGGMPINNPPAFTLYNIGTSVSYTLDLFGGNRRELEALCAAVDYQRFELLATQMSLVGNIVTAAIRCASLQDQINTTMRIIALQEKQLGITLRQYHSGGVAELDVMSQKTQLAQTQANLSPLQKQLEQTRHQIAVYIGKPTSEANIPVFHLDDLHLPETLPLSLPSAMVRQRPDIQAAQALLHQASANVGVATANLLPKITITGNLATEAAQMAKLFSPHTSAWTLGPTIMQPIFHGGALRAKRRSAIAALDQAIAAYQETVLEGFQNVADTLKALAYDAKTLQARSIATTQAQDTFEITAKLYKAGGVSYLSLLDAERQYHQASLSQVQASADRFADSAALFQALGGGWWNEPQTSSQAPSLLGI